MSEAYLDQNMVSLVLELLPVAHLLLVVAGVLFLLKLVCSVAPSSPTPTRIASFATPTQVPPVQVPQTGQQVRAPRQVWVPSYQRRRASLERARAAGAILPEIQTGYSAPTPMSAPLPPLEIARPEPVVLPLPRCYQNRRFRRRTGNGPPLREEIETCPWKNVVYKPPLPLHTGEYRMRLRSDIEGEMCARFDRELYLGFDPRVMNYRIGVMSTELQQFSFDH